MSVFLNPPVTDELPVAVRAYAAQTFTVVPDTEGAKPKNPRKAATAPASGRVLIFDTETTSDAAQSLRFGTYQYRQGDVLDESGIFYDPEGVTADELATLRAYADANGLMLRTREAFVDEVFFAQAYQHRATIVGFNLPFDISRLAIRHGTARTPLDSETATMRGAFTFALSHQKIYPNVRVKHMSQKAASISFAAPMRQQDGRGHRNRGLKTGIRRGHFVDVKTLANAIFARGFSLSSLSRFLAVPNPKLDFDDFAGPVTEDMVRYAVHDVQATWECYAELIDRFGKLNLTRTIPEKVYSEASIGKGYIREMGIVPWRKAQPDVPRDILARIMASYYGGRSEVRIRREIRQVMLCDFLSMYPTVCTLMGLWRFVIANGMTWRDATEETQAFLDRIDLDTLQSRTVWGQLTTLVSVLPNADIFPVRAGYEKEIHTTIGANYLSSEWPMWFTLADCVAAKLLTGKAPQIVEAMTFAPGPVQSGLHTIDIAGNPDYGVDPVTSDFFKRVIELRQSIKRDMKAATGDEHARLDTEQHALKICANSTSYGIWVEVNVETRPFRKQLTVHSATCAPYSFKSDKAEMPGTYFHPLLATLITGAARLMLAITERLIIDQGLDWVFCDTDSMAIAKPDNMGADEFALRSTAVVDWFAALNPYAFGGSILKIEDVNASLATSKPEPLHCLAISSKRYALFNFDADGSPIMRKVSAHGLGHLLPPYTADTAPAELPVPDKSVLGNGIERWHCDLWHHIVVAMLGEKPDQVRLGYHTALGNPAISRYAATSPELLVWFKAYNASRLYRDQVKPFGFLLSMSEAFAFGEERVATAPTRGRPKKVRKLKPIASFDSDPAVAIALVFDRDSGKPIVASALKSYAEALAHYHLSPESKFLNADYDDRGTTVRRHVRMTETRHIGKESHDWERQAVLGLNVDSEIAYGTLTGESAAKLHSSADRDRNAKLDRLRAIVAKRGLRQTARRLKVDPSNLRRQIIRHTASASLRPSNEPLQVPECVAVLGWDLGERSLRSSEAAVLAASERSLSERRKLGAFYTPERLSQLLADWAIRLPNDQVLEPSFGGCGFLAAARDALERAGSKAPTRQIYGCDIDPIAFGYLASVLGSPADTAGFLLHDFLDCMERPEWPEAFSVVLANPPYIPHHRMGKARVRELAAREMGIPGTGGRSGLWAYFLSHSVSLLAEGARMAWVLPGAFLQADYAEPIRTYLAEHFEKVAAIIIRERLFLTEGTDEETVILLADGYKKDFAKGAIELGEAQTLNELAEIIEGWRDGSWSGVTSRMSPAMLSMNDGAVSGFEALAENKHCTHFGDLAQVRIGLVTGANEFFVLGASQLPTAGLEPTDCLPILSKFRAASGLSFVESDLDAYAQIGGKTYLISNPGGPTSARVDTYLALFDEERKKTVSTFKKRSIWSQTTDENLPDAFFPVMHHTGPRLVLNRLGCHCTNTLHRVRFQQGMSESRQKLMSVSLLSTFSQISAELVGRRYGSGVLKHEPRDAERIQLLMPPVQEAEIDNIYEQTDMRLRSGASEEARRLLDVWILQHSGVEDASTVALNLNGALSDMRRRRRPRRG